METIRNIVIFTKSEMEGAGFKNLLEKTNPEFQVSLVLISAKYNLLNFDCSDLTKSSVAIVDSDYLPVNELFEFIKIRNKTNIIIYSRSNTPGLLLSARNFMLKGYISKNTSIQSISKCLKIIELGGCFYDSCFDDILKKLDMLENSLSSTEKNILQKVLLNSPSIKDLSKDVNLSKHAIEVHLSNIYKKAEVKSYSELLTKFSL